MALVLMWLYTPPSRPVFGIIGRGHMKYIVPRRSRGIIFMCPRSMIAKYRTLWRSIKLLLQLLTTGALLCCSGVSWARSPWPAASSQPSRAVLAHDCCCCCTWGALYTLGCVTSSPGYNCQIRRYWLVVVWEYRDLYLVYYPITELDSTKPRPILQ